MPLKKINELIEKELEMLEAMAGTGFSIPEIAEVLEVDTAEIQTAFLDKGSVVYKRYRKGYLESEFKLRQRIFKDAGFGSSPAQTLAKKIMDEAAFKINS